MLLTPLHWPCAQGNRHLVFQADFDKVEIQRASNVAEHKAAFVNVHSPGGVSRTPSVIRSRIIAGKLADYAVKEAVTRVISARGLPIAIQEYDEVRTDNWTNPDEYDLCLIGDQRNYDIEVRSSFSYFLRTPEQIPQKLSIYGWYVSRNKPAEPPRDFYWQFFYYMRPRDIPYSPGAPHVPVFEDEIAQGSVRGYMVGGSTKAMLDDPQLASIRRDQDNASYRAIYPICSGLDANEILRVSLGIR